MLASRRWVPGPARRPRLGKDDAAEPAALRPQEVSGKDLAFCAEFAVHGGVAVSEQGFKDEAGLIRMHEAGLLDLSRDPAPPFALVRVSLSGAARALLSGKQQAASATEPLASADAGVDEHGLRRNGFEVARGMIGAAVKAELAAWNSQGAPGGVAAVELRVMTRISKIEAPFKP